MDVLAAQLVGVHVLTVGAARQIAEVAPLVLAFKRDAAHRLAAKRILRHLLQIAGLEQLLNLMRIYAARTVDGKALQTQLNLVHVLPGPGQLALVLAARHPDAEDQPDEDADAQVGQPEPQRRPAELAVYPCGSHVE